MSACQSEPMQDAIRGVVCEACHPPEAIALAQECQGFEDRGARAADGLEEGVLIGVRRAPAGRAVIAPLHVAERLEVAGSDRAGVGAGRVVAPSLGEFHGESPPERDDTLSGRSRLTDTLEGFTAYGYSTRKCYVRQSPTRNPLIPCNGKQGHALHTNT